MPILGVPPSSAPLSSTYVPPLPDLNIPLQPFESSLSRLSIANRIKNFDHVFRNLLNKAKGDEEKPSKKHRKVSFSPTAKVILIPSRKEYHDAKIADDVWYTRKELKAFQQEARRERRQMMRYNFYTQNLHTAHSILQQLVHIPVSSNNHSDSTVEECDSTASSPRVTPTAEVLMMMEEMEYSSTTTTTSTTVAMV